MFSLIKSICNNFWKACKSITEILFIIMIWLCSFLFVLCFFFGLFIWHMIFVMNLWILFKRHFIIYRISNHSKVFNVNSFTWFLVLTDILPTGKNKIQLLFLLFVFFQHFLWNTCFFKLSKVNKYITTIFF